jgi:Lrp/AsnC family transcriptional regulator for asnA, asnC and gidA
MVSLDSLDRKIISELETNARQTNGEIASKLNSSEPTIRRRIERLLNEQVIKIVAVATPFQLGYGVVAILGIQVDHKHLDSIEEALSAMQEVRFAGITLGTYDVVVEAWFHSNEELLGFLRERLSKLEGIGRIDSLQVAKMIKYTYDWSGRSK